MSEIACGIGTAVTTFGVCEGLHLGNWESVLVAVASALLYALINIGTKIITSVLAKKGVISEEHKKDIDNTAEDISDDGIINGSNSEDVNN